LGTRIEKNHVIPHITLLCLGIAYTVPYSGKYSWDPNFVLFVLSLSERKFNTRNVHYDGRVFLCKMDRTKTKHTNQLEIAQNEILDPTKISRYTVVCLGLLYLTPWKPVLIAYSRSTSVQGKPLEWLFVPGGSCIEYPVKSSETL